MNRRPEALLKRSRENRTVIDEESKTLQSQAADTDIMNIMGRWERGLTPPVNLRRPVYADFSDPLDFQAKEDAIANAWTLFESLPATVRDVCDHSPRRLMEIVDMPDGEKILREAGWKGEFVDTERAELVEEPTALEVAAPVETPSDDDE